MNNPYLDIIIRMKDEASDTLHKFSGNAVSASQGFSKAFLGATAVAGAAAIGFGKVAFEAYAEAETAQAQLEHAVIGVSHATKDQLNATMALADQLERKGVLDGDNIKVGLAQLSTFGLSNKAVQGLGGSLADLAVNQFGTAASGDQLSQSANMIAKALNGQFGVLEKSGIRFTDAQKKMIEYGTEQEKVTAINEGFAQNLKATNETMRETSEGRLAHMKVQMENVKEGIGELISKAIGPIIEKISAWIDRMGGAEGIMEKLRAKVEDTSKWIQDHKTILLIVAGAIAGPLVLAFASWAAAALSAAVGTLIALAPILLIGAAVTAVILIFKALVDNWGEIKGFFNNIWNKAKEVGNGIKDAFSGVWETIKNGFKTVVNFYIKGFNLIIRGINKIPGVDLPQIPLLAKGGPVRSGMPYIVGEAGPELFVPRGSGQVVPNNKLGGSGVTIVIQGDAIVDSDRRMYDLATAVSEMLGRQNRQALNGGY